MAVQGPSEMLSEPGGGVVPQQDPAFRRLLIIGLVGAAVAVTLGIYANAHTPSSDLTITLGFTNTITMKVWLTTIAVLLRPLPAVLGPVDVRSPAAGRRALLDRQRAPDLGPARVSAEPAGRLSLPLSARLPAHEHARPAALDPRLPVLRRVCREGAGCPLPRPARERIAACSAGSCLCCSCTCGCCRRSGTSTNPASLRPDAAPVRPGPGRNQLDRRRARRRAAVRRTESDRREEDRAQQPERLRRPARAGLLAAPGGLRVGSGSQAAGVGRVRERRLQGMPHAEGGGATGSVGPNLDQLQPSAADVAGIVRSGGGVMPSFSGKLSDAQITAVASYVSSVAGH